MNDRSLLPDLLPVDPWWDLYMPATFGEPGAVLDALEAAEAITPLGARGDVYAVASRAFFVLGRPSATQRAQLETYARVFGHPVDLALLGAARDGLAAWLREQIVTTGQQYAVNYRATYDPATQWGALALDPSMRDVAYLTNALALARIEGSRASGAAKAELAQTHERIWARLQELEAAAAPAPLRQQSSASPS